MPDRPGADGGTGAGGAEHSDVVPDDLDADPPHGDDPGSDPGSDPGGGRDGRGARSDRPARWTRSRWVLPAATAAAVVVVGAATLQQARAAGEAELARARQLASLHLNVPSVFSTDRTPRYDARGRLLVQVQVQVFNAGALPVELTPLGTSAAAAEPSSTQEPVSLDPGAGSLLNAVLAVDCSAVPAGSAVAVDPSTGAARLPAGASWLELAVDVGGHRSEQRYLLPGPEWGDGLDQQLAVACAPAHREDGASG